MKREQIEQAAEQHSERWLNDSEEYFRSHNRDIYEYGFIAGAGWRIDSVWHDASEKYEIRLPSVVVFKNGKVAIYLDLRDVTYDGLWDEVKEYAYLRDLRPERKEETK